MKNKIKSKITPLIGLQWGDEGKGKGVARIASLLKSGDLIARFQGGNNAGHTIYHKGEKFVLHLLPSGVFGKAQIHLGAGMVINPGALLEEVRMIPKDIPFISHMSVSPHAVLTIPTHLILDSISEKSKGKKKIGSTGKGISPSYTDLTLRRALRVGDIMFKDFNARYAALKNAHINTLVKDFGYSIDKNSLKKSERDFLKGIAFLRSIKLMDSSDIVTKALEQGRTVIAEGAQGALLDVRFGHYPFVTSSHTIASGVGTGLGVPPSYIGGAIGICKAYTTKVGEGPFPTELGGTDSAVWCRDKKFADEIEKYPHPDANSNDEFEQGVALRRYGYEIGATTGRLRRTGWLDLPLLKYTIEMNNVTELVLTKLDVMSGFKKLKVCTGYLVDGKKVSTIPYDLSRVKIKPIYKTFPVWKGKLGNTLPKEALVYIKFLEKTLDTPIIYVGTGPEEHDVIERYWK